MITTRKNAPDLEEFIGTENYYSDDTFFTFLYTDGVHHIEETRNCRWLLKFIQIKIANNNLLSKQPFLTISLTKDPEDSTMRWYVVTDGNENELDRELISYQNINDDAIHLYFVNNVLMLPSEY